MARKAMDEKKLSMAMTYLLQEAARLFALTGGYRRSGAGLCLRKAVWVCVPAPGEISKGKERSS